MHTLWSPVFPLQKHMTASPEDSLPVFHPRWQQCYRQNTCVFTCTHYCSSPSAVAGITRGTICHAGRRLVCRHLESSNVWHSDAMVQESHGSKDSTTQSTTSLLKQLCFNAAFRKQRSLLSGCYPQQCVLRLVEEIRDWGRSQYIFLQLQNYVNWRITLEITRRLLCSPVATLQHSYCTKHWVFWAVTHLLAPLQLLEHVKSWPTKSQSQVRAKFGLCEVASIAIIIFPFLWGNRNSRNSTLL